MSYNTCGHRCGALGDVVAGAAPVAIVCSSLRALWGSGLAYARLLPPAPDGLLAAGVAVPVAVC